LTFMRDLFETPTPRVFTIPPAVSFLDVLAGTLVKALSRDDTPFALSDAIIVLPTRRAARGLAQAFLNNSPQTATLLPRIRTLGDLDPEDAGLGEFGDDLDQAPAIDPLARRLILARLIQARGVQSDWSADPVSALLAADALADLLDSAAMMASGTDSFDWSKLSTLVSEHELARHWEQSTTFLSIVTEAWPAYLTSVNKVDPGVQQRRNIEAMVDKWRAAPPDQTIVLAGSTGSMPVTRKLMHLIARLPQGMVILPGLDTHIPNDAWMAARHDDQHPQRALSEAIEAIGIERRDIQVLPGVVEPLGLAQRRLVINEALTPQASTADWLSRIEELGPETIIAGLKGLTLIEAASEEEEASLIAHELRETLENPDQTAALITPSAEIARRVAAKMQRWDIQVDVSSGRPISDTSIGSFLRHVMHWSQDPSDPVVLCALLGHPLTTIGLARDHVGACAAAIEIAVLRGPRKARTLPHLIAHLEALKPAYWRTMKINGLSVQKQDGLTLLRTLNDLLIQAAPLSGALPECARTIATLAEALAATETQTGAERVWRGEAGESAARFFAALMEHGHLFPPIQPHAIGRTLDHLMADLVIRPRGTHPRIAILGPLEARLLQFNKVVLAGLDEGVWPQPAAPDPFLSRPMRQHLGLPSPDTRIGLSAHDFAQFATAPHVLLTRSARRKDAPAVPSRWLWRLKTLAAGALGETDATLVLTEGSSWKSLLRAHAPYRVFEPTKAIPGPRPPVAARPRSFHATQIEVWIRDPYRTYVEKILNLRALDPLGGPISAGVRGSAIHKGFEVIADWYDRPPLNAHQALHLAFDAALRESGYDDTSLAVELARLEPTIAFAAGLEIERLRAGWCPMVEKSGTLTLDTPEGDLTVMARADRVDVGPEGTEILDFKSGKPPSASEVYAMFGAQLPVIALIAANGGFDDPAIGLPYDLRHIQVGGRNPKVEPAVHSKTSVQELVERAENTLRKLSAIYHNPERPYLPKPRVRLIKSATYDDPVDRLSRRAEWANAEDGE
jgi:ATP-dependent helicase/nuclease subunit B